MLVLLSKGFSRSNLDFEKKGGRTTLVTEWKRGRLGGRGGKEGGFRVVRRSSEDHGIWLGFVRVIGGECQRSRWIEMGDTLRRDH
jgi:hypothetical protein